MFKGGGPIIPFRIEDTMLPEDFSNNRNGRVHRIRNHENEGSRACLGDPDSEITNNTGVDLTSYQVSTVVGMGKDE